MVRRRTIRKRRNLDTLDKNGDICFNPSKNPSTPPGVLISYPNTSMASKTTKGSKKVKISGKMLTVKGSNFSKSEGDEAGTSTSLPSLRRVRKRSHLRRKK